ncbi:MAG TPA: hypothetical protein VF070_31310, partial [Streptosporangiaceae bacterium]
MRALVVRAAAPLQAVLLLAALFQLFALDLYGPSRHGDVDLYHRYAVTFWAGSPPFRQLPAEYPPLSILVFTLTMLPPIDQYAAIFGAWMAGAVLVTFWVTQRLFGRQAAVTTLVYL